MTDYNNGPFGVRWKGRAMMKGEEVEWHPHNFFHVTILYHGAGDLYLRMPDGKEDGPYHFAADYRTGHFPEIPIAARREHRFVVTEDFTTMKCWFVHRDADGNVTEEFVGDFASVGATV